MEPETRNGIVFIAAAVFFFATLMSLGGVWEWYKAGVQQRVWERQGIHMTHWEVFIGADPAQKVMTVKSPE